MKKVKNIPENGEFFSAYIGLVKTLNGAGFMGQVVSAMTEVGGIYVAAFLAFSPIIPAPYSVYVSAFIALIGTAIIEVGLRVSLPKSVDAVLYRRFSGLHLVITCFTWTIAVLLYAASTILSFSNSKTIVEGVTIGGHEKEIARIDSTEAALLISIEQSFATKRAEIDSTYSAIIAANAGSEAAKVDAAKRELQNVINKERRTGQSYATEKDNAKLKLSEAQASLNAASAAALKEKAQVLSQHDDKEEAQKNDVKAKAEGQREEAKLKQSGKVGTYGGGLAYFTILGNILLLVSIVINQVVKKGSGIKEKVQLSQYDINPHWLTMAIEAVSERINYTFQNAITNFQNNTPAPPLPSNIAELYDPSDLSELRAKLKAEDVEEEEYTVQRKRREIRPFGKGMPDAVDKNEIGLSFYEVNKRLRMYQKRLSSLEQKKASAERKNKVVSQRTLTAIQNNALWVDHYKRLKDNF